jgi:hypothetical protein
VTSRQLATTLKRLGIAQTEAARQLGVNDRTMRRWIAGDLPVPRMVELVMDCWQHHGSLPRKGSR